MSDTQPRGLTPNGGSVKTLLKNTPKAHLRNAFREAVRKKSIYRHVREIFYWFQHMGIQPAYFFLSISCSFLAILFNLAGLRLFIPFLRGVIEGDFTGIRDRFHVHEFVVGKFPQLFGSSKSVFFLLLGMILASFLAKSALDYLSSLLIGKQIRLAERNIRLYVFGYFLGMGKAFYDFTNTANLCQMFTSYAKVIANQVVQLKKLLTELMTLAAYLTILFWISWRLTLLALLVFPIQHFIMEKLIRGIKEASKQEESLRMSFAEKVFNLVSCIGLVKSYAFEGEERRQLALSSQEELQLAHEMRKKQLLIKPVQDIVTISSLLFMVLMMSLMIEERSQVAQFLVFFFVMRMAIPNFSLISDFRLSMASVEGVMSRFRQFLNPEPVLMVPNGNRVFKGVEKKIEINDLTFGYLSHPPVLHRLKFLIEKGKTTAIVGQTGAGKSTLAQLLIRFYDCPAGSILVDGIDIREFEKESLMACFAYVGQESLLFNDTIKNNVLYGLKRVVSDEELTLALKKAQLEELIQKLPDGLETTVGDRGVKLSGGEKQRIAIARAFLKRADILIFDEATSALDTQMERRIQEAVNEVIANRTAVVIAHRLSTIVNADKIIVLEHGRLIEEGTSQQLLAREGAFYEYWKAQRYTDDRRGGVLIRG